MPRASDNRGTCHADEVFDGQRWLSQAPGHGDLLRSTSDVQVCPYVPAVTGLRSRETYGYLCTFACTWHSRGSVRRHVVCAAADGFGFHQARERARGLEGGDDAGGVPVPDRVSLVIGLVLGEED